MSTWLVEKLDAEELRRRIDSLNPRTFLWQEEYPGPPRLRTDSLPNPLPVAGRIVAAEWEIRFFDRGARAVFLHERPGDDGGGPLSVQGPFTIMISPDAERLVPKNWTLEFVTYIDRGNVAWTRWIATHKESGHA